MEREDKYGLGSAIGSDADVGPSPDSGDGDEAADAIEQAAADDVMAAMKSGDKAAFRSALKAFVHLCYEE
jgi:hypothetical protein